MSAGLIVTRASTNSELGTDLLAQFTQHRQTLRIAGMAVAALAIVPGLPKLPFLIVGGLVVFAGSRVVERAAVSVVDEPDDEQLALLAPDSAEAFSTEMRVEPLELELAYDLVDLVDAARCGASSLATWGS
jgi:flagellar biosynthesis protein FlhA